MKKSILILGDILAIALITLIGFATHGKMEFSVLPRIGALFLSLLLSWFLLAPALGLFQPGISSDPKQLWRPALVMAFAAPLAAVLRGLILTSPIIPIFAVVLSATSAFGMLVWRGIYVFLIRKTRRVSQEQL